MAVAQEQYRRPKTKIVCTLGPSTYDQAAVRQLVEAGMSVARLNLSHGTFHSHSQAIAHVRRSSSELDVPVGIMVDVPGAKYRVGPLVDAVELGPGDRLALTSEEIVGDRRMISITPPGIHRDAEVGGRILLDDGLIEVGVTRIEGDRVHGEVVVGGRLTERRGVTTPGRAPSYPFPDRAAVEALQFAARQEADFVALSTVTGDHDIHEARRILHKEGLDPLIISKVERLEAIDRFDEILDASDGIMVARGDMGVEVPLAQVPVIQKDLISRCNQTGKPVITATQMLESMVRSQIPTRAEVTDVANAIFDGSDAVMLSGETSVGDHPVQAVRVMAQVAVVAEESLPYERIIREKARQLEEQTDDAISYDACRTAFQLKASLIVAFTESGSTAGRVAKYRPKPRVLALTPDVRTQRRLTLSWGVTPLTVDSVGAVDDFFILGEQYAHDVADVEPGDLIVLVAGVPIGVPGGTNLLRVMNVGDGVS